MSRSAEGWLPGGARLAVSGGAGRGCARRSKKGSCGSEDDKGAVEGRAGWRRRELAEGIEERGREGGESERHCRRRRRQEMLAG